MLYRKIFVKVFLFVIRTYKTAAASYSNDSPSGDYCASAPDSRYILLTECQKDCQNQQYTPFRIIDGQIEKIDANILCDSIHEICKTGKFTIVTIVKIKDGKSYSTEKYLRNFDKAYYTTGDITSDFLCVDDLSFCVQNICGSYMTSCDKIHSGFESIVRIYKESNKIVLDAIYEIAYDVFKVKMIKALQSNIAQADFISKGNESESYANSAVQNLLSIAENLDNYDNILGDYTGLGIYTPIGVEKVFERIYEYEKEIGYFHLEKTRTLSVNIIRYLTLEKYKKDFTECTRNLVKEFLYGIPRQIIIDAIKAFYNELFKGLNSELKMKKIENSESSKISYLESNVKCKTLYDIEKTFRDCFEEALPELNDKFTTRRDELCQIFAIESITRVACIVNNQNKTFKLPLCRIINGEDILEKSSNSRNTLGKGERADDENEKQFGWIKQPELKFGNIVGGRYIVRSENDTSNGTRAYGWNID